ncbi:MAG: PilZ domain-containing protein [Desulfobacterales bacterium]
MAKYNDKINIYDVNSLLFKIISFMSEDERRKLQSVLIAKLSDARNGKDLSSLITSISEAKRYELLERLINWYHLKKSRIAGYSKHLELRGYPRKQFKIPVELSKNGFTFICFTQNISNSGVFIQTDFGFCIHQQITMILSPPSIEKDISIGGEIVRVDLNGIGVKFDELLSVL